MDLKVILAYLFATNFFYISICKTWLSWILILHMNTKSNFILLILQLSEILIWFFIALCRIFEGVQINKKKNETGNKEGKIDYDLTDLLKFLDSLYDLSSLTFSDKFKGFMPHGREWIKAKMYKYLKEWAGEK